MKRDRFLTELRELLRLAGPLAAAQAGSQLMGVVDVAVLGRYGARELAASGVGNAVFFAFSVVGIGTTLGIDPLVAQAVGAGDHVRARRAMWQGVWLACAVSAVLTIVLLAAALALPLIGTPELVGPARVFLLIRTAGLLPLLLFFAVRAYLQAHHITRPMLVATVAANAVNLAGDIVLVFGYGPIPPMGIAGAALATFICTLLQLAIVAAAVNRVSVPEEVDHRPHRREFMKAFHVGFPVGLYMAAEVGVFALVAVLAGRLGTVQLAAHQLVISLASFTFTVAVGVATAGSVRVGIAIGGRDMPRTRLAGYVAFVAGALVMGFSAVLFALAPAAMARLITNDHAIVAAAVPLMLIAAVFQLSDGVQAAGAGVLRGAGDTRFVLYANIVGHWVIGLPIALLLAFHAGMGVVGLWWGLCVGLTVVALLLLARFVRLSSGTIEPLHHHVAVADSD